MSARLNLTDVLKPLERSGSVLVTDSATADGRFVLCQMATIMEQSKLWWCCSNLLNDKDTAAALKKMGSKKDACLPDRNRKMTGDTAKMTIRSIPTLLEQQLLSDDTDVELDVDDFVERLYEETETWCSSNGGGRVIIDDVTVLCGLLGESSTYRLLHAVSGLPSCLLIMRCSNGMEQAKIDPAESV